MDSLSLIYEDSENQGTYLDISDIVESLRLSTSIGTQCGKAELNIIGNGADWNFGSRLRIKDGDNGIFLGYLFSVSMDNEDRFEAVFYDQTRYLKNTDCVVYKDITASALFEQICDGVIQSKDGNSYTRNLKKGQVDASKYKLPAEVCEGRTLWDVLSDAIEKTLANDRAMYVIRDNYGELEFRNIETLQTDFVVDLDENALSYRYYVGIDRQSYTRARIGYEDKNAGERKWGVVDVGETDVEGGDTLMQKWGVLQYYRLLKTPKKTKELEDLCVQALRWFARPTKEVTVTCLGDFRISAGCGVKVNASGVKAFAGMYGYYVTSCIHEIANDKHTMELTLACSDFGG